MKLKGTKSNPRVHKMISSVKGHKIKTVLDLFCGDGTWFGSDWYSAFPKAEWTHVDICEEKLSDLSASGISGSFCAADFKNYLEGYEGSPFDLVICDNAARHGASNSFQHVLPYLPRIIAKNGTLVFNFGTLRSDKRFMDTEEAMAHWIGAIESTCNTGTYQGGMHFSRNKNAGIHTLAVRL